VIIRILLIFFLILFIIAGKGFANPIPGKKVDSVFAPAYGISYSFEQAGWYGLDPRKDYEKLLDEIKPKWVRLSFFWDQMVNGETGEFNKNFDDLRFGIEEAKKRDIGVIVALGAKTPYFPEYHWPKKVSSKVKFGEKITINHPVAGDILEIDRRVVDELSNNDNIIYWQVENEPLLPNVNNWLLDPGLIAAEVEVVREADPKGRHIILNHPAGGAFDRDWQKLLPILEKGDVLATNAYFKTQGAELLAFKIFRFEFHIPWPKFLVWPVQSWPILSPNYDSMKTKVEREGKRFWIMEMQAEPYVRTIEDARKATFSFKASDINLGYDFLKSYEIESVGFWGVHFWQYREKAGDKSWFEIVKQVVGKE